MAENNVVAAEDEYVDVEADANDDNAAIDAVRLVSTEDSSADSWAAPAKGSCGRCTGADDNIAWMDGEVDCSREPNQLEGKGKVDAEEEAEVE
jgi:hypothetical protein